MDLILHRVVLTFVPWGIYWLSANYTRQPINHGSLTQCSFIFTCCMHSALRHLSCLSCIIPCLSYTGLRTYTYISIPIREFLSASVCRFVLVYVYFYSCLCLGWCKYGVQHLLRPDVDLDSTRGSIPY